MSKEFMRTTVWGNDNSYVIYEGGLWRITHHNQSPDEDLRPQWGWGPGGPEPSTWTIRHCLGPAHPKGLNEVEVAIAGGGYDTANAMEVLAFASL